MKRFLAVVLFFAAVPAWTAEIYTFSPLPSSGQISGVPGQTVGWGYAIENDSTALFLVTTGLASGSFQFATPNLIFDFPILAPGTSVTVPFDAAALTGLLALTWDTSAPPGAVESGNFLLSAEWWNGDPLAGGNFAFGAPLLSQPYVATVMFVAEPGTAALLGLGLLAAGGAARLRRGGNTGLGRVSEERV